MAQALFDDHPLQEYLKESGDTPELWPGSFGDPGASIAFSDRRPFLLSIRKVKNILRSRLKLLKSVFPNHHREFTERFKYDVITSKLLTTAFDNSPLHTPRRSHSPDISFPGNLSDPSSLRNIEATEAANSQNKSIPYALVVVAAAIIWQISAALAVMIMITSIYFLRAQRTISKPDYIVETLRSLEQLKFAVDVWNSVVSESVSILESQEQGTLLGPTSPSSFSSSLCVTLRTSLLTTHTQCDNVRQLMTALTCPTELPQLSEMYAPPSPMSSTFSASGRLSTSSSPRERHLSLPEQRRASIVTQKDNRTTWNGSYTSLAGLDSQTRRMSLGRIKRRPSLLTSFTPLEESSSTSLSPRPLSPIIVDEREEDSKIFPEAAFTTDTFGSAALSLQRKRRTSGIDTIGLTHRRSAPSMRYSVSNQLSPPASSSSRFTTFHAVRHPLSLSAIHQALQGAMSAKRYACAHLLALRFEEDEDDTYWENVRSVMALLTTTFEDASSRLEDALADVEQQKSFDQIPETPVESPNDDEQTDKRSTSPSSLTAALKRLSTSSVSRSNAFAPVPNHIARFAAHVDAISSALADAQEHLKNCVISLQEENLGVESSRGRISDLSLEQPPALRAYEQLRREIGLALRECERGRGVLIDSYNKARETPLEEADEEDEDEIPNLAHDSGSSGESDGKHEITPSTPDNKLSLLPQSTPYSLESREPAEVDETTRHLLLTSTVEHLPPPGIEQVFESDFGAGTTFTRERSKLTREERIRLVRARRESVGNSLALDVTRLSDTDIPSEAGRSGRGWGPGSEVVQELKDVIWKVSERRRSLQEKKSHREASSAQTLISETTSIDAKPYDLRPTTT